MFFDIISAAATLPTQKDNDNDVLQVSLKLNRRHSTNLALLRSNKYICTYNRGGVSERITSRNIRWKKWWGQICESIHKCMVNMGLWSSFNVTSFSKNNNPCTCACKRIIIFLSALLFIWLFIGSYIRIQGILLRFILFVELFYIFTSNVWIHHSDCLLKMRRGRFLKFKTSIMICSKSRTLDQNIDLC